MSELSDKAAVNHVPKQLKTLEKTLQGIQIPDGIPSSFNMPKHFAQKVDHALRWLDSQNFIKYHIF